MFYNFHGDSADEIWWKAFDAVNRSNAVNSRCGETKELLHATLSISNPKQKWITSKVPPISVGFALAELIWILHGSNDSDTINYWNPALPKYAGECEQYPGAYGERIFKRFGFDQLDRICETLAGKPESRQAVMLLWDPETDLPKINGEPNNDDIPCNICSMIKIRDKKLEWTQVMRSNDLFLGLPYNIVQFTSIQEILASWLNIEVGSYNHISDSLHIYTSSDCGCVNDLPAREVINSDSLIVSKKDFKTVIDLIYGVMFNISHSDISSVKLIEYSEIDTGYEAYNNILRIICLYSAHKQGFIDARAEMFERCTNSIYKIMWSNWLQGKSGGNCYVKNN